MNRLLGNEPGLLAIIARNVHELNMADVFSELKEMWSDNGGKTWLGHRLRLVLQHYADEGKIRVEQYMGGLVGQEINIEHGMIEEGPDRGLSYLSGVGRTWIPYTTNYLKNWRSTGYANHEHYHLTESDWSTEYATWNKNIGENRLLIRMMVGHIPVDIPGFEDFEPLRNIDYMMRYPAFIPVSVTIDRDMVSLTYVDLDKDQLKFI